MAWRRSGDKPLSESMMVSLLTHICVTRPQWVNDGDDVFNECRSKNVVSIAFLSSTSQRNSLVLMIWSRPVFHASRTKVLLSHFRDPVVSHRKGGFCVTLETEEVLRLRKRNRLPRDEIKIYRLDNRPQLWLSVFTLAMSLTLHVNSQKDNLPYLRKMGWLPWNEKQANRIYHRCQLWPFIYFTTTSWHPVYFRQHKNIFSFSLISQHWDDRGTLSPDLSHYSETCLWRPPLW